MIKEDSTWKAYFDLLMLIASVYNVFTQAYYSAFGLPEGFYFNVLDYLIEVLFFLDFCFCFCQEYKDEETYTMVTDIKKIAKHYLKGSCIFDLLANIPFELFFTMGQEKMQESSKKASRMYKMLKFLRIPRLFELLNVDRVKQSITDFYSKRLLKAVQNNDESESYPILKALMYVQMYKILRLSLLIFTSSYFLGIVWHIYVVDLESDVYINPNDPSYGVKPTFATAMLGYPETFESQTGIDKLIKVWYFAITTLSTIGFGDFTPVSSIERLLASMILMFGVTVFSFIMGQFIEILMNYKSLWKQGDHKNLSAWIALLSRFNNGNPLNKELITHIEDFFDFYWVNNRLSALSNEKDLQFMDQLPIEVQGQIFVDYLFTDFLYKYRTLFIGNGNKFSSPGSI